VDVKSETKNEKQAVDNTKLEHPINSQFIVEFKKLRAKFKDERKQSFGTSKSKAPSDGAQQNSQHLSISKRIFRFFSDWRVTE